MQIKPQYIFGLLGEAEAEYESQFRPGRGRRKIYPYDPSLKELARFLRNNSTRAEIHLWMQLKGKFYGSYDFHRQKPLGSFIADFFCHELCLAIELDGSVHDEEEVKQRDCFKEMRLNEMGIQVLRFRNELVFACMDYVLDVIRQFIQLNNGTRIETGASLWVHLNVYTKVGMG